MTALRSKPQVKTKPKAPNLLAQANNYLGMFSGDPKDIYGKLGTKATSIQSKIAQRQAAGKDVSGLQSKLQKIQASRDRMGQTAPFQQQNYQNNVNQTYDAMNGVNANANAGMQQQMNYIQNQGAFNPGNFDESRRRAEDNVMSAFNRQMNPEFTRQNNSFREQMALEGVAEGSEKWNEQYRNMSEAQSGARQNAMNQAFTLGQGEQQQAYGQAYQTYQTPYQNLGAFNPYYQGQMNMVGNQQNYLNQYGMQQAQNQWQQGQNAMDRQHQIKMAGMNRGGGGGGGGRQPDPNAGMNSFYDQYLNGMFANQPPQQNPMNGFTNGLAAGAGAGITNWITN